MTSSYTTAATEFQVKLVSPYRGFVGFLITLMVPVIWLGKSYGLYPTHTRLFVMGVLGVTLFYIFLYLLSYGRAVVKVVNGVITIEWKKKFALDSTNYTEVDIRSINKIKVDRNVQTNATTLKIYSEEGNIALQNIGSLKPFQDDLSKLVYFLELAHLYGLREEPIPETDSWTEFRKKSYAKYFAYLYLFGLIAFLGLFFVVTVKKGIKAQYLAWLLIVVPQFFLLWRMFKGKTQEQ